MFRTLEISDARFESDGLGFVTVGSPALRGRADLTLYVPEEAARHPAVPLVILLHGVYGSHWAWAFKGGAHRTAARLIAEGAIPPMALAMPSDGLRGDGTGYFRYGGAGPDFERWIVEEVPAAVAQVAPEVTAGSPLFIAGLSMGGFGALRLAAKFPQRFRAVSGHSSVTHYDQLAPFIEEPLASSGGRDEDKSVLETVLRNRHRLPPIRFDCGTEDSLLAANRELHRALEAAGVPHRYEEFSGGHDWPYWEEHLADTLCFFASVLAPDGLPA